MRNQHEPSRITTAGDICMVILFAIVLVIGGTFAEPIAEALIRIF